MVEETICKHNQYGFCKFADKCRYHHIQGICTSPQCELSNCTLRHPKKCRYFHNYNNCKFGDHCAYDHTLQSNGKETNKEKDILKVIQDLKDEIDSLKEKNNKLEERINDLEDDTVSEELRCQNLKYKCDECHFRCRSSHDLKIHIGKTHNTIKQTDGVNDLEKKVPVKAKEFDAEFKFKSKHVNTQNNLLEHLEHLSTQKHESLKTATGWCDVLAVDKDTYTIIIKYETLEDANEDFKRLPWPNNCTLTEMTIKPVM